MFSDGNERHSRTWRITAHFSLSEHGMIYDSRLQYLPDYISSILTSRLHRMQTIQNSMKSIPLLSFTYPRQFRGNADVPVNVILHFSNSIGFLTIQALLNTSCITVTCTPVGFGAGKPCPDVTLHPIFTSFLRTSSKDTGPAVNPNLYVRVDIRGLTGVIAMVGKQPLLQMKQSVDHGLLMHCSILRFTLLLFQIVMKFLLIILKKGNISEPVSRYSVGM
jgi:hypothetical protein